MRSVLVLLCSCVCGAHADGFLAQSTSVASIPALQSDVAMAAVMDALSIGCGEPCMKVLRSAVGTVANKSASTVLL